MRLLHKQKIFGYNPKEMNGWINDPNFTNTDFSVTHNTGLKTKEGRETKNRYGW